MPRITIAEWRGSFYLLEGEEHLRDLLSNTLPDDTEYRYLRCETYFDIQANWVEREGSPSHEPWRIHTRIGERVREIALPLKPLH